jgi:formylglycine-generating enzyme required for sulfatase activity
VGNGWEWQLDYFATPFVHAQCTDCADLTSGGSRAARGGAFSDDASAMAVSYRRELPETGHSPLFGVRCARAPRLQDTEAATPDAP